VDGQASLLFGPYATSNPKFLKNGSILDLPLSLRPGNLIPNLAVAFSNFGLIKYLVGELLKSKARKFESLLEFMPSAKPEDWELLDAGQRAQIIKKDAAKGGVLQFGTEIITAADGSISGLLGASPGASTAVYAMLEVLRKSFSSEYAAWEVDLKKVMPSLGIKLNADAKAAEKSLKATAKTLKLN
jgi:malate dehydrogenase (quinone)